MKSKTFWVTRDKDAGSQVFLWSRKPQLDEAGQWWGKGKYTDPEFEWENFTRITGIKLKKCEIRECQIEVVKEA